MRVHLLNQRLLCAVNEGKHLLHVARDSKYDSSLVLVKDPSKFKTVIDPIFAGAEDLEASDFIMPGIEDIDCVESGGPHAVVYDVVCGGFDAPTRRSARTKVVIVLSEELMAAYAANRTAAAVGQLEKNGIVLAGLVTNLKKGRNLRTLHRRLRARVAVVGREGVVTDLDRRHGGGYSATVPFESVGLHNVKRAVPLGWSVEHRRRPRPRPRAHRPAETAYRQQSRDSQPKRIHAQLVGWLKPCP